MGYYRNLKAKLNESSAEDSHWDPGGEIKSRIQIEPNPAEFTDSDGPDPSPPRMPLPGCNSERLSLTPSSEVH